MDWTVMITGHYSLQRPTECLISSDSQELSWQLSVHTYPLGQSNES